MSQQFPSALYRLNAAFLRPFDPGCPKRISLPVLGQQGSWLQLCPFQEVTFAMSFWSWGKYLDISDGASRPFLGTVLELFNGLSEQLRFQHLAIQGSNLAWTRCQWAHKTCSHLWYWQINSQIPTVWNTTKPTVEVIIGSIYFGGPYWGCSISGYIRGGINLAPSHFTKLLQTCRKPETGLPD